jgi:hypothetical protein
MKIENEVRENERGWYYSNLLELFWREEHKQVQP